MAIADMALAVLTDRGLLAHIALFQTGEPLCIHAYEQALGPLTPPPVLAISGVSGWLKIVRHLPLRHVQLVCRMTRAPAHHPRFHQLLPARLKAEAVFQGRMELLLWLHASEDPAGGPWPPNLLNMACYCGHIEIAQWLIDTYPESCVDELIGALASVAKLGHLAFLQQLIDRFPAALEPAVFDAASQWDVIHFLHQHTSCSCTPAAMDNAAERGDLAVVQFLHENRSEGCTTRAMDGAAKRGHLEILRYLHEHRSEGWTRSALDNAIYLGDLAIVQFLHEHRPHPDEQDNDWYSKLLVRSLIRGSLPIYKYLYEHCNAQPEASVGYHMLTQRNVEFAKYIYDTGAVPLNFASLTDAASYTNCCEAMLDFVMDRTDEGCVFSAIEAAWRRGFLPSSPTVNRLQSRLVPGVKKCDPWKHRRGERGPGCCTLTTTPNDTLS